MSRKCQICIRDDCSVINAALLSGESNRSIAKRFDIDHNAVQRHRKHIPQALTEAREAKKICSADELLEQQDQLLKLSWMIVDGLVAAGDSQGALKGIKEVRENLKVLLEVAGKINQNQQTNVIMNPQFLLIQNILWDELRPYPDIRDRIAARLGGIKTI